MHSKETVFLPKEERTDKPSSLFFLYCAANIGILGLVYGAIIVGFHLSFFQAILATVLGSFSFALVGLMSLSGHDTGTNTFILSRAAFGFKGNLIPAIAALVSHAGWLSINVCTGTLTVLALFVTLGFANTPIAMAIALAIFVTLVLVSVLFSHKVLIRMQTISTYLFGFLTLVILVIIVPQTDWSMLMAMPSGDWLGNFLPALAFVAAGTGIGWTSYAADYSCHQDPQNSRSKVAWAVTLGGAVPLILMLSVGILLGFAKYLKETDKKPARKIYQHITVFEEVGHGGSASIPADVAEILAVDMGCVGDGLSCKETQVSICAKDSGGPYHYDVVSALIEAARTAKVDFAVDVYPHYGSDAEAGLRSGIDCRHGLIGSGVYASHGYERSHVKGMENTFRLLKAYLNQDYHA